ncbi:hypothetical protein UA08_00515 [Talaromyces atroroseus]|uniref:Zn(2)-C6 fungal-type domain-containing protein n=1 Tax=Talaromyces atroroseus TaxID=1441469 RepID=A0A225BDW0_TALAT|nr:hypothetical protein UA08_00515 [Talaromyces atroroseus]OKL64207.1 hypothetical protein UA08_00515 [Talaromyces atroroseus]
MASLRSKSGCWTCREKKVRCGEERPQCHRCVRLGRFCDYTPRPRKPYTRRQRHARRPPPARDPEEGEKDEDQDEDERGPAHLEIEFPGLSSVDQQAVHCFRTTVSASIDTKDPEFSVPFVICRLGQTSPMLMHMICALGHQEIFYQCTEDSSGGPSSHAVEHYGASMRLLAQTLNLPSSDAPDLDAILATLWLMVLYEQKFGDGCALGLMTHLQGAASVLQSRLGNLRRLLEANFSDPEEKWHFSPFAGRMIVWLAFLDGGAAFVKLGGDFNRALGSAMVDLAENAIASRLRGFTAIHRYSASLFRSVWGPSYPQQQLLEDLENRNLFYLYGECGQMRFVLSQLENELLPPSSSSSSPSSIPLSPLVSGITTTSTEPRLDPLAVARTLHEISLRYSEIFEFASHLRLDLAHAGERRKFIMNIRFVVPLYHATVLWYFRITAHDKPFKFKERQRESFREIINLAYQAHADEGEKAMARIAWPLFIAGIEGDDPVHEEWVLKRFWHLRQHGENFSRAFRALSFIQEAQRAAGRRVPLPGCFDEGTLERFAI